MTKFASLAVTGALAWSIVALAGCTTAASGPSQQAAAPEPPPQAVAAPSGFPRTVVFACETGDKLTATFTEGAATIVDSHGRSFHLTQQETGSGIDFQGGGQELRGKGEAATWTGPDASPVACSAGHSPLVGTRWELVEFQSADKTIGTLKPADPSHFTLDLMAGGRLAMQLDCNRATGQWEAHPTSPSAGALLLGEPAMTRAFCLSGSMDTQVAAGLDRVRTYQLDGDRLVLGLEASGGEYTWRRITP